MITCKDCRPILEPDGGIEAIELCPRHGVMNERRRYALLQAAAQLAMYSGDEAHDLAVDASIDAAEALLAEIEEREKVEAQ